MNIKTLFKIFKNIVIWLGSLFIWFLYAYYTLDRSEAGIEFGLGNPIPGGYSFIILPLLIAFLLRKSVFNHSWKKWNLVSKILVLLLLIFGIFIHYPL